MISKDTKREKALEIAKECEACGHCCKHASGILIEDEKKALARHFRLSEEEFESKYLEDTERFNTKIKRFRQIRSKQRPHGQCIMLAPTGKCTIHKVKPLYCRITNCNDAGEQLTVWFALNYFININDAESIRQWAQYLKSHSTIPGGELDSLVPHKQKLDMMLSHDMLH
ncbi:MAG: YkgJ family cysteine cluster protein [Nanoarchaeota archaeon]|nr:YkgJ family cysteine cluster protein [Nanoarchaeota archaeon]